MDTTDLNGIVFWHWWIAGLVLLTLEVFVPGAIFLWMGLAAFVVGIVTWLVPLGWQAEFVIFGVLSIVAVIAWRKYRPAPTTDQPTLNQRGRSYVGRTFTLAEPIVNGVGRLRVDDSQWRITGADVPAGTQVRITAVDGTTFKVEPAH